MTGTNGNGNGAPRVGTDRVKQGLAQMLKGGVIVSTSIRFIPVHV
jgi:pyridoxal 5'-phosphate synthase pdxS subunit